MTKYLTISFLIIVLTQPIFFSSSTAQIQQDSRYVVAAEQSQNRVVILDTTREWADPDAILWEWKPQNDPYVRPEHVEWFDYPSEVKPVNQGKSVMITASGGGVAMINVGSRTVEFYGYAGGNPHSVDLLPGNFIVSTSSDGNYVSLFTKPYSENRNPPAEQRLDYELSDGHGLYWDEQRDILWALGGKPLKRFIFGPDTNGKPILREDLEIRLPVTDESLRYPRHGGHDLSPVPCSNRVYITDMDHIWEMDLDTHQFYPFEKMHEAAMVKSVSRITCNGPVLIVKATESWWSDTVIQVEPEHTYTMPGARFYKVRWWPYTFD